MDSATKAALEYISREYGQVGEVAFAAAIRAGKDLRTAETAALRAYESAMMGEVMQAALYDRKTGLVQ